MKMPDSGLIVMGSYKVWPRLCLINRNEGVSCDGSVRALHQYRIWTGECQACLLGIHPLIRAG